MRINAARAAAYMAGVLNSKESYLYTKDKTFDIQLLKSLIPLLNSMSRQDSVAVIPHAQHALKQITQLK